MGSEEETKEMGEERRRREYKEKRLEYRKLCDRKKKEENR